MQNSATADATFVARSSMATVCEMLTATIEHDECTALNKSWSDGTYQNNGHNFINMKIDHSDGTRHYTKRIDGYATNNSSVRCSPHSGKTAETGKEIKADVTLSEVE